MEYFIFGEVMGTHDPLATLGSYFLNHVVYSFRIFNSH